MSENNVDSPLTLTYKEVDGISVLLDVYLPPDITQQDTPAQHAKHCPAVVYFHGGGLVVGNRQSWFPTWLKNRLSARGIIFISADYRLVSPSTGYDVLADVKDAIRFVAGDLNAQLDEREAGRFRVNPDSIAVAGSSAGGYCAYLCATHAVPKPKAILSMYGGGGDFLIHHYLTPKTESFFRNRGREMLDPAQFSDHVYPFNNLQSISDSPIIYDPQTHQIQVEHPANSRILLLQLYIQLGVLVDYIVGQHEPSLSATLREAIHTEGPLDEALVAGHKILFPQFNVTSNWPATYLIHGTSDTAVLLRESQHLHSLLVQAGVEVILEEVPGREHAFDDQPDAEAECGGSFDAIVQFLDHHLASDQ